MNKQAMKKILMELATSFEKEAKAEVAMIFIKEEREEAEEKLCDCLAVLQADMKVWTKYLDGEHCGYVTVDRWWMAVLCGGIDAVSKASNSVGGILTGYMEMTMVVDGDAGTKILGKLGYYNALYAYVDEKQAKGVRVQIII